MTGREARKSRTPQSHPEQPRRERRVISWLSAWTATGSPSRAASLMPSNSVTSSARGNSGSPESHMNALKPTTPRSASSSSRRRLPGTAHPRARSRRSTRPSSGGPLARRTRAALTVHGVELSGMSTNVVPPPAASARLPGRRALPVGAARLVEVHVRVDHAGEHVQPAGIDLLATRARAPARSPRSRPSSIARSACITATGSDQRAAADHDVMHGHPPMRRAQCTPTSRAAATSSSSDRSSGWWLIPPGLRRNSIADGTRRATIMRVVSGAAGHAMHRRAGRGNRTREARPSSDGRHQTAA